MRRRALFVKLLRAGAAGYALKQSSSAELINAIRTVASGRPYLDPELNHGLMGLFVQGRSVRKPPDLTPRRDRSAAPHRLGLQQQGDRLTARAEA